MPVSAARVLRVIAGEDITDAELLSRFADRRDEAAFALLVRRHGAMVYGVCRRLLPEQDAEDAFQATFLVLAEKAQTAAPREVANWLYGVARRAALLSRRSIARRRERTGEMPDRPAPEPTPMAELLAALDEELSRLPDVYRTVIVLCDLEGRTRREASAELGWPEGTVAGRLARARELLAKRLARHATTVSVAAVLAGTASARVPDVLSQSAVIPSGVAALTREVLGVMARGKMMKVAVAVLLLGCAGFGMVLAGQKPATKDSPALPISTEAPMNPPKADDEAWGKEVDGLQIGLTGVAPAYRHGDKAKMEVKLRNVGKAEAKITYSLLEESAPQVAADVRMTVAMPPPKDYFPVPVSRVVKPGETVTLYKPEVKVESSDLLRLGGELRVEIPTAYLSPGKYRIGYGGMIRSHPKLATGTAEFEVKEPDGVVTAWGEVRGGLQAGLSIGEKRAYHHGETVTLAIRLRNAGKEPVKFHYIEPLVEHEPVVTVDGRPRPQPAKPDRVGERQIGEVELAPGKEIVLHELKRELRPAKWLGNDGIPSLYGAGKFGVRYEQVLGDPAVGHPGWKLDPVLSKLATGTVEFEVKEKPSPVTVWGKETGGLQAGLEVKEKRVYRLGETVTLLVRVRNVSKQAVKFEYIRQYLDENPPGVTGADGKVIPQATSGVMGVIHAPVDVSLEPGKEIVLGTRIHGTDGVPYELCSVGGGGKTATMNHLLRVGAGKVTIQYEKVFGNSSIGRIKIDPDLAALATGKLEIEVVAPEVRLPEPEPDVQEVSDPLPIVRGPLQKDGARALKTRKDVVGKPVRVEGIAWGQPFGLKGQEGTVSPHAGPHVVYEGGAVFVRGIDFTGTKARGKPVRVTGTLRFEPKTETRWGDIKGYYYIEATKFEVIDAVADPYLVYLEK